MPLVHLPDHRIEVAAPRARRLCEQLDVLGEERDDRELADGLVRAFAGAVKQISPRPAPLPIGWGKENDVHRARIVDALDVGGYPRRVRAPPDQLGVVVRAWRVTS